jgi:hypothetical protein
MFRLLGIGALLVVFFVAVAGNGQSGRSAANTNSASRAQCLAVPTATIANIETGVRAQFRGSTHFSNYQAVRSPDHTHIYYVAAKVGSVSGADDWGVAIWALNRLDHGSGETGLIWATPEIATRYTDWGNGSQTQARFGRQDVGYRQAKECARLN